MAGITAKAGEVAVNAGADLVGVLRWNLNEEADNKTYVSSNSAGWAKTAEGAKRWSGSMDLLLEDGVFRVAPLVPGTLLTSIELKVDGSHSRQGAARIDRVGDIEVDIDGSGLVKCTVDFTGDGALT